MASPVDICNMAVSHFGGRARITSIDPPDGTTEAGDCARYFGQVRREALESFRPHFAMKRVALAQAPVNLSDVWRFAYAVPSDCLTAMRVLQTASVADYSVPVYTDRPVTVDDITMFTERSSAEFVLEGSTLYTNQDDAVLLYVWDVTDTTKWTGTFTAYVSYLLASYIVGPIIKGQEGARASAQFRQIAASVKAEAAVHSANQSAERVDHFPDHMRRR